MKLLSLKVAQYRRFEVDSPSMDVANTPIAVVGPNEVGKTSFLRALLHLNHQEPFQTNELTRGGTGEVQVGAIFAIEEDDWKSIRHLSGQVRPAIFRLWKKSDGNLSSCVNPSPTRDLGPRRKAAEQLRRLLRSKWFKSVEDEIHFSLDELFLCLDRDDENLTAETIASLRNYVSEFESLEDLPPSGQRLVTALRQLAELEEEPHPADAACQILMERRPLFLWFDAERRYFGSPHSVHEEFPAALRTLVELAGVDIDTLGQAVAEGDQTTITEIIEAANRRLEKLFEDKWQQARVRGCLDLNGDLLHVFVTNKGGRLIPIAERSDGLRNFIALLAFVEAEAPGQPVVLLIDEAESHLHYDAQADLVRVFTEQMAVGKIIYTTHSAGCLPSDLGTGVRVIEPVGDEDVDPADWDRSRVHNWFWTSGPGFSPLLLAMGAGTFVFAATRKAVIGEGPSDAILLPTFFREALGLPTLDFQVAPGLASVSPEEVGELSLEASRVAYFVDGDKGGQDQREKLIKGGVPRQQIVMLGTPKAGLSLEDVVRKDLYVAAVNAELKRWQQTQISGSDLPDVGRKRALERWCVNRSHNPPSERAVAHQLLDQIAEARLRGEELFLLEPQRKKIVATAGTKLLRLLDQA